MAEVPCSILTRENIWILFCCLFHNPSMLTLSSSFISKILCCQKSGNKRLLISLNSLNERIWNHYNVSEDQFKDPVCYLWRRGWVVKHSSFSTIARSDISVILVQNWHHGVSKSAKKNCFHWVLNSQHQPHYKNPSTLTHSANLPVHASLKLSDPFKVMALLNLKWSKFSSWIFYSTDVLVAEWLRVLGI